MTALGAEGFSDIARRADRYGEAVDGLNLRTSAKAASVVCEYCGPLDASLMGWTSDWITLCQEAIGHVEETGHRVAVESYQAAVYGPTRRPGTKGDSGE